MSYKIFDENNINAKTIGGADLSKLTWAYYRGSNSSTSGFVIIETEANKINANMVSAMLYGYAHNTYLPLITAVKFYVYKDGGYFFNPYAYNIGYNINPVYIYLNSNGYVCIAIKRTPYLKLMAFVNVGLNSALNSVRSITYAEELPTEKEWYKEISPYVAINTSNMTNYIPAANAAEIPERPSIINADMQNAAIQQNTFNGNV